MLGSLLEQCAALARQAAAVLLFWARRSHHRADAPLAARPGHERAQEHLAIDHIRLRPAVPPIDRDRGRVDDMALDPVGLEQTVNPKTVGYRWRSRLNLGRRVFCGM